MATLIFVCWSTKVPTKQAWINQEFVYALRSYEYQWHTSLTEEEVLQWQKQFFESYISFWETEQDRKLVEFAKNSLNQ